jgi:glycosyltransferase involved in cell wall biosynthesis
MSLSDQTTASDDAMSAPNYILMLVPHEPKLDPRIKWVTELCAKIGPTEIIGFTDSSEEPRDEDGDMIHTERVLSNDYTNRRNNWLQSFKKSTSSIWERFKSSIFINRIRKVEDVILNSAFKEGKQGTVSGSTNGQPVSVQDQNHSKSYGLWVFSGINLLKRWLLVILEHIVTARRFFFKWVNYNTIIQTLYQGAIRKPLAPKVIICHDLLALAAGVKLKAGGKTPIIYDSHEYWPEVDLNAKKWENQFTAFVESKLIRQADVVITVSPQLARQIEKAHKITGVISVPNAEPISSNYIPSFTRPISFPVKFLLQGQMASGRGIEEFLSAWKSLDNPNAVLIIRAPENDFLVYLRNKFSNDGGKGQIIFKPPVLENELISAAAASDVGIIPYGGPSLNHIYACPNKLSQYMQAGLAILYNEDLQFVSSIISECNCGSAFNLNNKEDFALIIRNLTDQPKMLHDLKQNAYTYSRSVFNWEVQSDVYQKAIQRLYIG